MTIETVLQILLVGLIFSGIALSLVYAFKLLVRRQGGGQ